MNLSDELNMINKRTLDRIANVVGNYQKSAITNDSTVKRVREMIQQNKDQRRLAVERAAKHTYDIGEAIKEADENETWG